MDQTPAPIDDPADPQDGDGGDGEHGSVDHAWTLISVVLAGLALLAAAWGVALGWRAIDEVESSAGGTASSEPVMVSETEFAIADATVAVGGSLHVMNDGTVEHNLAVEDTDIKSPNLAAGESATVEVSELEAGTYTMFCEISGHRDAGMEATLTVSADGAETAAPADGASAHGSMDMEAMQKAMLDSMTAFPAETEGTGNAVLQPTEVRADGTKVFDLVAEIVDWERAPGDVVQAWTYNGTVPAPSIRLDLGDKVEFRLKNELEIGTDLHLHGLNVDNAFDGVAPYTQDVIEPGATFTYKYTADEVAVAMYHPHFMSQVGMPNGMFGTIFVGDVPVHGGETIGQEVIPAGVKIAQQVPMVLNDSGVIGYSLNGKSFPATAPVVAKQDDWLLITYFNEGNQIHPMHLHAFDQIVVAKDGYPLDNPYVADVVTVAPGERYSVLVKMDKAGTWVWHCHILNHVENDAGMFGMVTAVVVE